MKIFDIDIIVYRMVENWLLDVICVFDDCDLYCLLIFKCSDSFYIWYCFKNNEYEVRIKIIVLFWKRVIV